MVAKGQGALLSDFRSGPTKGPLGVNGSYTLSTAKGNLQSAL